MVRVRDRVRDRDMGRVRDRVRLRGLAIAALAIADPNRCNRIWETTRHNGPTTARTNLLRTCYRETAVMDFGL